MRIAIAIWLIYVGASNLWMNLCWLVRGEFSAKTDALSLAIFMVILLAGIALLLRFWRKAGNVLGVFVCLWLLIVWARRNIKLGLEGLEERGVFYVDLAWVLMFFTAWAILWLIRDLLRLAKSREVQAPGRNRNDG